MQQIKNYEQLTIFKSENPAFKKRQRQARKQLTYRKNVYALGKVN